MEIITQIPLLCMYAKNIVPQEYLNFNATTTTTKKT